MKFPKELSKERLSLLSPEDRKIYEQEHSKPKMHNIFDTDNYAPIFEDSDMSSSDSNAETLTGIYAIDEDALVSEEMKMIYDELFSDVMTEDEFFSAADPLNEEIVASAPAESLNEGAEGLDCMAWVRGLNLGWLGKLAMGGLAALGTGLGALIVAGRDKIAMARLKKYMNRLVEIMDQGIQKKRPLLTAIMPKKWSKWRGERNLACFRTIQEMADRSITNGVMNAAHKLGFFARGQMMNISSGAVPQAGSGLDDFRKNVLGQVSLIVPQKPVKNKFDTPELQASKQNP